MTSKRAEGKARGRTLVIWGGGKEPKATTTAARVVVKGVHDFGEGGTRGGIMGVSWICALCSSNRLLLEERLVLLLRLDEGLLEKVGVCRTLRQ